MATKQNNGKNIGGTDWFSRNLIALVITSLVVIATAVIAAYAIKKDDFDFIGQSLLPLWGTWMGTVMAFYFGKANFEAATNAIRNTSPEDKIAGLLVKDKMIQFNQIVSLDYETEKAEAITKILDYPRFKPYNRFAVFNSNRVVKALITRGLFYEFLYKQGQGPDGNSQPIILDNLLSSADPYFQKMTFEGYEFVSIEATVLDAKRKIDSIAECHNIFITQNGKKDEPVLGLLTDNNILELMQS